MPDKNDTRATRMMFPQPQSSKPHLRGGLLPSAEFLGWLCFRLGSTDICFGVLSERRTTRKLSLAFSSSSPALTALLAHINFLPRLVITFSAFTVTKRPDGQHGFVLAVDHSMSGSTRQLAAQTVGSRLRRPTTYSRTASLFEWVFR